MALSDTLTAQPPPLRETEHGVLRVGDSRVSLESLMWHFKQGRAPEQIRMSFPTLKLDDIYALIAYYVWNRKEVEAYLERAEREMDEIQRECESRWPTDEVREKLLARRAAKS